MESKWRSDKFIHGLDSEEGEKDTKKESKEKESHRKRVLVQL